MVRKQRVPIALVAAIVLAACGGASTPTLPPPTNAPSAAPIPSVAPAATQAPAPSPVPTAALVAASTATAQPVVATAAPARLATAYKGIEQGITADGFPYLGRADAPITLTDYSDFL